MIGIFDSGLGGLLVAKEISEKLNLPIIYFGDTAHLPYGTKSKKAILEFSLKNTEFLLKKGAKIIVIACNTSSAIASDFLKKQFKIPVFNVIDPAIDKLAGTGNIKKVGIIATPSTIESGTYQKRIKKRFKGKIKIFSKPTPLLVPLIEEGWLDHKITREVLKEYLLSLKKKKIDALILGCTHYPLIKNLISKEISKNVKIIDSEKEITKKIELFFSNSGKRLSKNKKAEIRIFLSDRGYRFKEITKKIFKKEIKCEILKDL